MPTLLLAGTETKDHPSFAVEALESLLPDARTVLLEGQGHGAHVGAPDLVARAVADFVVEASR